MHQLSKVNLSVLPWSRYFGHDQVHTDSQTECSRLLVKHILTVQQHNDAIENECIYMYNVYTCRCMFNLLLCFRKHEQFRAFVTHKGQNTSS